ncbi:MAG: hypothetical protein Q4D90_03645, partial [bacterium]|nr:hypothetical protein [bacterium]
MKRKLVHRASVCALLSAMVVSQTGVAYAAVPTSPSQVGWQYSDHAWRYYNATGIQTGWQYLNSHWYYLSQEDGKMLTGWQYIDGHWYYLNTANDGVEGQLRSGWMTDAAGRRYFLSTAHDGTFGRMLTGWQWIDGHCYYFVGTEGADQGKMLTNALSPDGFLVNADGRWVEEDGSVHFEAKKGYTGVEVVETVTTGNASGRSSSRGSSGGSSSGGNSGGGSSTTPSTTPEETTPQE